MIVLLALLLYLGVPWWFAVLYFLECVFWFATAVSE